jgi:hypothetical protein
MNKDSVKMLKDERQGGRTVSKFETGGESGPIENRNEYEQRLEALPPEEKDLAQQSTRFADICRYFSDKKMDIPPQVLDVVEGLSRSPIADRIRILKDANQRLMEYLNDVGEDPQIRQ